MKIKSFLAAVLAALTLTACSNNEPGNGGSETPELDVAYLSLKVASENPTRNSTEGTGTKESDLVALYLFTMDNSGRIMKIPGSTDYFILIPNSSLTPGAFRVSAEATKMLAIANPGTKLKAVINAINDYTTLSDIIKAINDITIDELADDTSNITKGFAMINSGPDDSGNDAGDVISDPLINISAHIHPLANYANEAAAKSAAEDDRVDIKIERIAAKLEMKQKALIDVKPEGAVFTFDRWTIDAVNTAYYPFAQKTLLSVYHNPGSYKYNFYTKDPNFSGNLGEGLNYTEIDDENDYDPILVAPYTWMASGVIAYAVENTMDATEQKFGNATRIVIKGKYYPDSSWSGDWFNFAGINYETLEDLQDAYTAAGSSSNLATACDKMYTSIKAFADKNSISLTGNDFSSLKDTDLDLIPNGGEVIKDGRDDVIRWYQKGLSYYYYEIRHDDVTTEQMAFGKYGIVRNNWYSMTLGTVNGPGTPWYPDINNPGPGDPDPVDPIDESAAYLGIEIEVAPWIIWDREIVI